VLNFPYLVDFIHKTKQNCFPRAPDMLPSSFSPSAGIFLSSVDVRNNGSTVQVLPVPPGVPDTSSSQVLGWRRRFLNRDRFQNEQACQTLASPDSTISSGFDS
jgi:hypothetical protein